MTIRIPSDGFCAEDVPALFRHEHAQSKGDDVPLQAIRFAQWPYADCQQEAIDVGPLYRQLRKMTADIVTRLSLTNYGEDWLVEELTARADGLDQPMAVNLYDELHPMLARVIFRLLFGQPLPAADMPIFQEAIQNFHTTLKRTSLRSRRKRLRMRAAIEKYAAQSTSLQEMVGPRIETSVLVDHLGTTFFHTAIIQCAEYTCHAIAGIVQNPRVLERCMKEIDDWSEGSALREAEKSTYLGCVMKETLRMYPLFGSTFRQLTGPVTVNSTTYDKNTLVRLDFNKFHSMDWPGGDAFQPERWDDQSPAAACPHLRKSHYLPFGTGPRSCPGQYMAIALTRAAIVTILKRVEVRIPNAFTHTRFLPLGLPVVLGRRHPDEREGFSSAGPSLDTVVAELEKRTVAGVDVLVYECPSLKTAFMRILKNPAFLRVAGVHFLYRCYMGLHSRGSVKLHRIAQRFGCPRDAEEHQM